MFEPFFNVFAASARFFTNAWETGTWSSKTGHPLDPGWPFALSPLIGAARSSQLDRELVEACADVIDERALAMLREECLDVVFEHDLHRRSANVVVVAIELAIARDVDAQAGEPGEVGVRRRAARRSDEREERNASHAPRHRKPRANRPMRKARETLVQAIESSRRL